MVPKKYEIKCITIGNINMTLLVFIETQYDANTYRICAYICRISTYIYRISANICRMSDTHFQCSHNGSLYWPHCEKKNFLRNSKTVFSFYEKCLFIIISVCHTYISVLYKAYIHKSVIQKEHMSYYCNMQPGV